MDIAGENRNIEPHKGSEDHVNYHAANMSSHWQVNENNLTNTSVGLIPMGNPTVETSSCFSAPMAENSFCPPIWDQPINTQNLGYCDINVQNDAILKGNTFVSGIAPHSLPHFPSDSGFIERAARFSCFSSGNLVEMMNPFNIPDNLNPRSRGSGLIQGQRDVFGGNSSKPTAEMHLQGNDMNVSEVPQKAFKNGMKSENLSGNGSDEAEFSGRRVQEESYSEGFGSSKRKRGTQVNEHNGNNEAPRPSIETVKDNAEIKQKGDIKSTSNVKEGSQGSDAPKEEYIHVRARRGQATNSHSLAERVRREKISERMKFLQDLVPGCSKVTGKAVMLDEIINYVQSLQRQVEFLSMKLATVNPGLDFNIEGLLAKDMLQHRAGSSSSLAFPSDMTMHFPPIHHPSPPGLIQACLASNSSEILPRPTDLSSIAACGGFKESTSQIRSVWEDELHNIVHMGFNASASLNSQDLSGSLPPGQMKDEP